MTDELVEAIRDGQIVRISRKEAIEEGLIIMHRPVLEASFVPHSRYPVRSAEARENMRHMLLDRRYHAQTGLVENFHWEIAKARKLKSLSRYQLATILGVSEEQIIALEQGDIPKDDYLLISKLERYLGIKLRKPVITPGLGEPPEAPKPPVHDSQDSYPKDVTLADLQKRKELMRKRESSGFS